jgi:hypothetical protein
MGPARTNRASAKCTTPKTNSRNDHLSMLLPALRQYHLDEVLEYPIFMADLPLRTMRNQESA